MNAIVASHKTTTFKWLLKREFWENRGGFFWAPVIAGGIQAILYSLAIIMTSLARGNININGQTLNGMITSPPEEIARGIGMSADTILMAGTGLALLILAFVVFFYALGSLYDDRRDRSVLFWKSLPISDAHTVLSKAVWALLLAPVIALIIGLITGLILWIPTAIIISVNGFPGTSIFTHSHPLRVIGNLLVTMPVQMLWSLPTVGWLMFCSAWARSKPFLWAVLIPVLGCVLVSMMNILPNMQLPLKQLWYVVAFRGLLSVTPTWLATSHINIGGNMVKSEAIESVSLNQIMHMFASVDLWIGVVIGIAFIATAIYLRRWRELAD
jgi:ABC-2 type transport system permease protein